MTTRKNPSGKYVVMSTDELEREREKFQRAVERQQEEDRRRAEAAKKRR